MALTRGFVGRRPRAEIRDRVPPGQHETTEFPVLSIGPTPLIDMQSWQLAVTVRGEQHLRLSWSALNDLAPSSWNGDIHCVTRWSKFDTSWRGISIDTILEAAAITEPPACLSAVSIDGYSTNLPSSDVIGGKALIATHFEGEPLSRHHGGPARLFVPHLYFWKSAKWVCELNFNDEETPGFWESRGYHIYGDPWREQRFKGE